VPFLRMKMTNKTKITVIAILYTTNCKYGEGMKFCDYVFYHSTVINYSQILISLNGWDMHEDTINTE
jgi:hypothetical protein